MSNTQLGAHQQLPDSITLTKASVGRSYRASGRPRKASPKPLAYLHLLMPTHPTSLKSDWGKESTTSLISCFSHVRPPVITSSFYQPSCLSLEFLLQWCHEIRRSAKADPFHGNTREAAVVRLPGGVSKRRAFFLFVFFFKLWKHEALRRAAQARCHVTMATNWDIHTHTHIEVIDSKSFMQGNKTAGILVTAQYLNVVVLQLQGEIQTRRLAFRQALS